MLYAYPDKSSEIKSVYRGEGLMLDAEKGRLRLQPLGEGCIRITYTEKKEFAKELPSGIDTVNRQAEWKFEETPDAIYLHTNKLCAKVCRATGSISFRDPAGKVLLQEREKDSHVLEEFQTYRLAEGAAVETEQIQTPDGVKEVITQAKKVADRKMYHTRLHLQWQQDEALYGLGQAEEGLGNLRGHRVYVHQANRKIAIPMLVSSLGYGILVGSGSPMIFADDEYGSYLYTEASDELDYFFLYGGNMEGVVKEYRRLTGKAAMLPKWAFGYLQSQERYESAEELEQIAEEYRRRGIGMDALVLDWCSWEDGMWGQKSFDKKRFPDPAEMMRRLHEKDTHLLISVWPNMDPNCDNYREMQEANLILPSGNIYNALSEEGRKLYWKQAFEGIFQYGLDGWWCDSSEPLTPEWSHKERVEPGVMYAEYCRDADNLLPTGKGNTFALYHAKALYEGQRGTTEEKRVINLTRSAWTGQQKYGTILWSGDVAATWDTLRRQVAAGLHFCASGLPYWTTDIGAFFVKNSVFWYWKGDFDNTLDDAGYRELFTRWYQWGAFLPIFRGHGTDCRRELWLFGKENGTPGDCGDMFYQALLRVNKLRYMLLPYIYSLAGLTWLEDASIMKHLAFAYPEDERARECFDQYLFGDSIMVCPVTEAMYYGPNSMPLKTDNYTREVYLPEGGWYDFYTGEYLEGGRTITAGADIAVIPLYVKAGTILPMTEAGDRVQREDKITFRVYPGADATLKLYGDSGDGYGYEKGEYHLDTFTWQEESRVLTDEQGNSLPYVLGTDAITI